MIDSRICALCILWVSASVEESKHDSTRRFTVLPFHAFFHCFTFLRACRFPSVAFSRVHHHVSRIPHYASVFTRPTLLHRHCYASTATHPALLHFVRLPTFEHPTSSLPTFPQRLKPTEKEACWEGLKQPTSSQNNTNRQSRNIQNTILSYSVPIRSPTLYPALKYGILFPSCAMALLEWGLWFSSPSSRVGVIAEVVLSLSLMRCGAF